MESGCRILVADESAMTRQIFRKAVARANMPVTLLEASNGHQCKELLVGGHVHLAFIDVYMPGPSGIEVALAVRQARMKPFITLMSAREDDELFDLARQLKVYEFLVKPFELADIHSIIRTYNHVAAPLRALIVAQSTSARQIIEKVLYRSVFHLTLEQAPDEGGAVAACRSDLFDIVFLDCNMPGPISFSTLERLKSITPSIKVVVMSSERNPKRAQMATENGAAAFVQKPFSADQIDAVLHQLYGLPIPMLNTSEANISAIAPSFLMRAESLRNDGDNRQQL